MSFDLPSLSLKVMPIGIAYALWSGIGIILTVIAGRNGLTGDSGLDACDRDWINIDWDIDHQLVSKAIAH